MTKMSVVLERLTRVSKYTNIGNSIKVPYSIIYRLSYVIIHAEHVTWKGGGPTILFFSISTASSGLLSYGVRKGPAKFCKTFGLAPL